MSFVTTNIRLPEDDYLRLKSEAATRRKSLAAIIREKISAKTEGTRSPKEVQKIMDQTRKLAKRNAKYLKGIDGVTVIRQMRDNSKW